jgi:hypothetical protein
LKNLGLNIRRAKIKSKDGKKINKFYITDAQTSEKILKSARLEEIRLTILNNLLLYHPESGEELAWGLRAKKPSTRDLLSPLGMRNRCVHPRATQRRVPFVDRVHRLRCVVLPPRSR